MSRFTEKKVSNIIDCYLEVRPGDGPLFDFNEEGLAKVNMSGYAIIPIEKYNELKVNNE